MYDRVYDFDPIPTIAAPWHPHEKRLFLPAQSLSSGITAAPFLVCATRTLSNSATTDAIIIPVDIRSEASQIGRLRAAHRLRAGGVAPKIPVAGWASRSPCCPVGDQYSRPYGPKVDRCSVPTHHQTDSRSGHSIRCSIQFPGCAGYRPNHGTLRRMELVS